MDLEALTAQQLELTLQLSDILSIQDITIAATVLSSFDWNIEKALSDLQVGNIQQTHLNPPSLPSSFSYDSQQYNYDNVDNNNDVVYDDDNADQSQYLINQKKKMFEEEYVSLLPLQKTLSEPRKQIIMLQNHKKLAKESRVHRGSYLAALMNQSETLCKSILDTNKQGKAKYYENKKKISSNRSFINYLYNTYNPKVNFTFGTFFLNLTRAYLQNKYLLVYIHSVAPEIETKFKKVVELILKQKEIAHFINQNCITYGMFDNSDDYQLIQKYIPLKDLPAFALFKLNKAKRSEQFISCYVPHTIIKKISAHEDIFLEWAAHSMGMTLKKKQGSHIEVQKVVKEEIKKDEIKKKKQEDQVRTKNKQQQQYIAHRDIRKQQDELWAQLQKTYYQKKQISYDRKQHIKQDEQQLQKRKLQADKDVQPEAGENVIEIKFRMPISGISKSRRFLMQTKIQKMFTFVDCYCRDQFQQKFNNFDLKQSFPPLSLMEKKDKPIGEVFQGSNRQNIIVRQL